MTRTKLTTIAKGRAELNHGAEQSMRGVKAKLTNSVRQQRAGAKLNNTSPARRWAALNCIALQRMGRRKTELNNTGRAKLNHGPEQ